MNFSGGRTRSATFDPAAPAATTQSAATVVTRRRGLPNRRAVLIVAFLGAAMYLVFTQVLNDSGSKASTTVNNIGGP